MVRWVVTEHLNFTNPDSKYLNIDPHTVVRLCETEKEAWDFIAERIRFPLYSAFKGKFKRYGDTYRAFAKSKGSCKFEVHKYIFT